MANDHTIYVRQGHVGGVAESNKNPSPAQTTKTTNGDSPIGTAFKAATYIHYGKTIMNSTISEIGFLTGDYELQEKAEMLVNATGTVIGLLAAPMVTIPALAIKTGFDVYATGVRQRRDYYKQQQAQVLTGQISVNGGRY